MAYIPPILAAFLGPRALGVVENVADGEVRERVIEALLACMDSLVVVDALNLAKHELAELETPDLSVWEELAPDVRNVLVAVRKTADQLIELFPATSGPQDEVQDTDTLNVDDLFGGDLGTEFDAIVQNAQEELGAGIATLAGMLQRDFIEFGGRLRSPQVVADRWELLGLLHEFKGKCSQCLEAIVATVLRAFSDEAIEEVLPRYTSTATRALQMRRSVVDLSFDLNRFDGALKTASVEDARVLHNGLIECLDQFAENDAYRFVSPVDKHVIIFLRIFLNSWEKDGEDLDRLRAKLDDSAKCIELMRSMNEREELTTHDKRYLKTAQMVLEAGLDLFGAKPYLEMVYGRSEELDVKIRQLKEGHEVDTAEVIRIISGIRSKLDM